MRIGEFNRQLNEYLSDGQIKLKAEQSTTYNHYILKSVKKLRRTLNFINSQEWLSDYVDQELIGILSNFSVNSDAIELTNTDYSKVTKAINSLNVKLAITTGILKDFAPDQDEHTINVKLPDSIVSLGDLQEFNQRLGNIFKKFNIAGDFKITGFDRGSEWYEIYISAKPLYSYFVAILSVSLGLVTLRKKFIDSEIAKVNLRMLKQKEIKITEEEWRDEMTSLRTEEEATKVVKQLGTTDNKTEAEMMAMVIKATTEMVKELEKGTEFHLSLNPPKYLSERNEDGHLQIDYTTIPPIKELSSPPKELTDGKSTNNKK